MSTKKDIIVNFTFREAFVAFYFAYIKNALIYYYREKTYKLHRQ